MNSNREEALFHAALELPDPADRAAFFDKECAGDPALRARIERLLNADAEAPTFLQQAASPDTPTLAPRPPVATMPNANTEKPGDTIGRYRLLSVLGEGGMGTVFLAEQHEPVKRRVALKVIKLGMDTKSVIARFDAERQALAMMDHPGIAKVFDAGATDNGRPFFVMELVEGVPLTKYCDEQRLGLTARLNLFTAVCQALQHAHLKGIIHRDLKPSNILVTSQDGHAVPKVIDFGVAKATGRQLSDATLTAEDSFLGTPAYASPEQAGAVPDVDTRSDIYSLGVILYELLTGQLPLDPETLRRAAVDEVLRRIREEEPSKPSTRVASCGAADQTTIAGRRGTEARRLANALRGDLDWIVMKALEKDRTRRYDSASSLAQDLERHLNNEPVSAAAPSVLYLFGKYARRHRVALGATMTVAVALISATIVSVVETRRATLAEAIAKADRLKAIEQKDRADAEAAISKAVNEFLQTDLLRQSGSRAQADAKFEGNPKLTVREVLDRAAARIGDRFSKQPLVEAAIRTTIGSAYIDIGEASKAIEHLEKSRELRKASLGSTHRDTQATVNNLALAYQAAGRLNDGLLLQEEILQARKATLGPAHHDTLLSMNNLALAHQAGGRLNDALPLFVETLRQTKATLGPAHPLSLTTMNNLAVAYRDAGRLDDALPIYEDTLESQKARLGPEHPDTLMSMNNLGAAYWAAGRRDDSIPLFEETLRLRKAAFGAEHPNTLMSMNNLALAYRDAGRLNDALPLHETAWKSRKATLGSAHPDTLVSMNNLALAYQDLGRLDDAVPLHEEALKAMTTTLGPEHPTTLLSMNNLALVYRAAGRLNDALPLQENTYKLSKAKLGQDHPDTLRSMNNLAMAYKDMGRLNDALPLFEETLKLAKATLAPEDMLLLTTRNNLAGVLEAAGKLAQAETLYREALALHRTRDGPASPQTMSVLVQLASNLLGQKKYPEAEPLLREALATREKIQPEAWTTFNTRSALGGALLGQKKFVEAEPLLLSGYEGMKARSASIPPIGKPRLKESMERLVQLYEATGDGVKAAKWQQTLDEFNQPGAARNPAAKQP